jgi:hypothetical protein
MGLLPDDLTRDQPTLTQHAMLVPWGLFARQIGLVQRIQAVPIPQQTRDHTPQSKLLELFVATLSGCPYLQDISLGPAPLDQDAAVAQAWDQEGWADYSGVSRTLKACTPETVATLEAILSEISRPYIDREVMLALRDKQVLVYDGDLTGRPVSSTSTSYPDAAFGWMDDEVRLGYQAALVSLQSPTYGRLWLSVKHHPGDTVAMGQVQAMVQAAEATTGVRPRRRTELLRKHIADQQSLLEAAKEQEARTQERAAQAREQLQQVEQDLALWQQQFKDLEAAQHDQDRPERPYSKLSKARRRVAVCQQRLSRRQQALAKTERGLDRHKQKLLALQADLAVLEQRLAQFEEDNRTNGSAIRAIFRLDAGFGSGDNIALLIEMGYDVYTKAGNNQVVRALRRQVSAASRWTKVGKNAEMLTWKDLTITNCPYPLDAGLERFHAGDKEKHAVLLHYGVEHVTQDSAAWFNFYNGRQTIEAGVKEGKGVLQMHHFKVRSPAGLAIQELLTVFAANFIRWAARSFQQSSTIAAPLARIQASVKRSVRIGANTPAWVIWQSQGCLLRFTEHSPLAGIELVVGNVGPIQLPLPLFRSPVLEPS